MKRNIGLLHSVRNIFAMVAALAVVLAAALPAAPVFAGEFAATTLSPSSQSCNVGTPCSVGIVFAVGTSAAYGIHAWVNFDATKLQVTSVTGSGAPYNNVVTNVFNNATGTLEFEATGSAVANSTFTVATIVFNPIAAGTATVNFSNVNEYIVGYGPYGVNGLAVGGSITVTAPVVVYTSGGHVQTWDPIYPTFADPNWTTTVCTPIPAVGPGAPWVNPHSAFSFGTNAHVWQPGAGFTADWINAWNNINSQGTGGHSWTKYSTPVSGTGSFVLNLLADNCSWIYLDGTLVGFQGTGPTTTGKAYPVNLSGNHTLEFIIFDGGGLAGGMYRLETNSGTIVFPTITADNASVTVNQPTPASNTGTYSDGGAGASIGITASVGSVTKTGTTNGTWSWSNPSNSPPFDYNVTITATNGSNSTAVFTTFHVHVNTNAAPTVAANSASVSTNEGTPAANAGTYNDPNVGDNVAITASVGTVTKTGTNSGTWSWSNPAPDGPASYTVTITANDGVAAPVTTTFDVTVHNVAPNLGVNVNTGNTVYYVDWTVANPGAGTASGVITLPDGSTVNVTFDALNPDSSHSFFYGAQTGGGTNYWNPSAPYISAEVPNAPPTPDILQLSGGNSTIYKVTLSQPIVDPIMAIVSLGSSGNTITYNFDSPFTIVSQGVGYWGGCPTCLAQLPNNVLRGTEGHGTIKFLGTVGTFSWTVPSPETWHGFTFAIRTTAALGNTNVQEGQTATNSGTWSDPGVNDNVALSASIGSVVKNVNGTWNWSFNTTDGPTQTQTVTITATDKDGAATSKTFPLTVNNVAPTAAITGAPTTSPEGTAITLGSIVTDPGTADTFTYAWTVTKNGNGYASGSASSITFTPDDNGTYVGSLTVTGKDGGADSDAKSVTINNVAPTATFGNNGPVNEGSDIALSLTSPSDPSSADTTAGFQYAFDCGSGYGALGAASTAVCSTNDNGARAVKGKIQDKDGGFNEYTANVTINNVAPTNVSLSFSPTTINENQSVTLGGSFTDPGILDTHTVVISWGDGSSDTINLAANVLSFASISHQYLDDGSYPGNGTTFDVNNVQVTVTDKDGGSSSASTTVTVNNVAPVITGVAGPVDPAALGSPEATVSITVNFTDVGSKDAHSCTFVWDDGSANSTVSAGGTGDGSCTATHTYTTAGVNTVGVTVTDDDTGSATSKWEFVVVYDPSAGFVTGGGWINSIAGSYKPNPALTGKANFGFVSKYLKGANVPTGNTEFQFKVASFNFHSENYQWLVVAGCKAQYKGTGTVNGSGSYTFLLTGYDAQAGAGGSCGGQSVDRFRIKITDSAGGVVYDNNPGGSDDMDATDPQAIGGGSIAIHSK